jgi:hypothetical protein
VRGESRLSESERRAEELYAESTRRHYERQRQRELWEELRHCERMIVSHTRNLEAIVGRYQRRAARCAELLQIDDTEGEAA